ncbi:TetR/AcrR family transcriptional regulator [Paracoccus sp. M683]|uniref:TetR/AcrR family transcriptional regulator n=1 Tax=Paracoccus sp. M683 TaxID=2594268 RepID=UPI0021053F45|nr:TetR/AcrR family transcriptional regulator [Paracoccus sp. M683]
MPITKGRKFKQVLEGARRVFLREGYAGASVDDIAGEAKVSKATLYSYFPDKELMFTEVFRADLALDIEESLVAVVADRPAAEALPFLVHALAVRMVSGSGVNSYRLRVGESARFPDLARECMDRACRRRRDDVRSYLERWTRRGELEINDMELAAEQLIALATALIRDRALFLGSDSVTDAHMRRATVGAAHVFLAAYGPRFGAAARVHGDPAISRADRAKTVPPME